LTAAADRFRFYTHQYKTGKGDIYYFCYEWGYQVLEQNKVLIVNWQKYMKPLSSLSLKINSSEYKH
jgi:hypothetical protein